LQFFVYYETLCTVILEGQSVIVIHAKVVISSDSITFFCKTKKQRMRSYQMIDAAWTGQSPNTNPSSHWFAKVDFLAKRTTTHFIS